MSLQILAFLVDICKLFFIVKLCVNGSKFPCTLAKLSVLKLILYRESEYREFLYRKIDFIQRECKYTILSS